MTLQKGFIGIILLIGIIIVAGAIGYFAVSQKVFAPLLPAPTIKPVPCTQEAKQCLDGSYVGRTGANCEFAKCPDINPTPTPTPIPTPVPNEKQITLREGQQEGPLLVQKVYPTYITGLSFREYPIATNQGQPITLYIGQSASNGCTITLTLKNISGASATFTEKTEYNRPCPICLAENTLIDTPNGKIPVQQLQTGMPIWTINASGARVEAIITKTSKTPVPPAHQMVYIILEDKREVFASPGHPIGDDRVFGDLSAGDLLDGSRIIVAKNVAYHNSYTYDILPSGPTGFYWANGILLDSTLR